MADTSAQANREAEKAAERGPQSDPAKEPEEVRYDRDELQESAFALLGVSSHAVAGALASERRKTFTLDEAKAAVDKFLKREVA